jgi:hypothetical protein
MRPSPPISPTPTLSHRDLNVEHGSYSDGKVYDSEMRTNCNGSRVRQQGKCRKAGSDGDHHNLSLTGTLGACNESGPPKIESQLYYKRQASLSSPPTATISDATVPCPPPVGPSQSAQYKRSDDNTKRRHNLGRGRRNGTYLRKQGRDKSSASLRCEDSETRATYPLRQRPGCTTLECEEQYGQKVRLARW